MARLIDKDALIAGLEERRDKIKKGIFSIPLSGKERADATFEYEVLGNVINLLGTFEIKEVNWERERMEECPYRQVGCTMYEGKILECRGACSWVVDYPKLKELKAQKGE